MLGVLPGTIGTLQATEALKVLLGIGEPMIGKLLLYNALDMSFDFVKLKKNPKCRVCGPNADIKELIDYEEFCGVPGRDHEEEGSAGAGWDITATELAERVKTISFNCWMCANRTSWKFPLCRTRSIFRSDNWRGD